MKETIIKGNELDQENPPEYLLEEENKLGLQEIVLKYPTSIKMYVPTNREDYRFIASVTCTDKIESIGILTDYAKYCFLISLRLQELAEKYLLQNVESDDEIYFEEKSESHSPKDFGSDENEDNQLKRSSDSVKLYSRNHSPEFFQQPLPKKHIAAFKRKHLLMEENGIRRTNSLP